MEPKVNSYELANLLKSALLKGQTENQLTVNELLKEIISQLESLMKR